MAAPGISETLTLSTYNTGKKVADNISKGNAALTKMSEKGNIRMFDGGVTIREALDYGTNSNVQWFSGTEPFSVGSTEAATAAEFTPKQLVGTVTVSGLELMQNSGKGKLIDLLATKMKNLDRNLRNTVATDMHGDGTGSSSKTITGFLLMLPTTVTSGTYGGINRATAGNEFWRPQIRTSTSSSSAIQGLMNDLYILCTRGTDHPDLILAGATIYGHYLTSLQLIQQITNPKMAELGFTTLRYIGADVVLDNNTGGLTATHMLFLNTDFIYWRPYSGLNFAPFEPSVRTPVNQDVHVRAVGFFGNMTSDGPQFCGRLNGA